MIRWQTSEFPKIRITNIKGLSFSFFLLAIVFIPFLVLCSSNPRYIQSNKVPKANVKPKQKESTSTTNPSSTTPKNVPSKKTPHAVPKNEVAINRSYAPEMRIPSGPTHSPAKRQFEYYQKGNASYYANKFHGRKTANGERYDENALTAAHPKLPFNTVVKVTNTNNNRSVVVRINDRGPFTKGRIIDVSRAAAEQIGMLNNGIAKVIVEIRKM